MKLIIIILIGILSLICGYLVRESRKHQIKQELLTVEKALVIGKNYMNMLHRLDIVKYLNIQILKNQILLF